MRASRATTSLINLSTFISKYFISYLKTKLIVKLELLTGHPYRDIECIPRKQRGRDVHIPCKIRLFKETTTETPMLHVYTELDGHSSKELDHQRCEYDLGVDMWDCMAETNSRVYRPPQCSIRSQVRL